MEESNIGISVDKRKRISRKYKGMAMTWKRLFIGVACLAVALSYLLVMAIRGNIALQRQISEKQLTDIK